jgi:hypothetical protein
MVSLFNAMLIKCVTGRITVRRRLAALRLGCAVCNALFSGMLFGFAAFGALACQPQVDDFSHAKAQRLLSARSVPWRSPLQCRIQINCADKVARITARARTMCEIAHFGTHRKPPWALSAFFLKRFVPAAANIAGAR